MARTNKERRWQTSEQKLLSQMQALHVQRATLLENADKVRDLDRKRHMWQAAQRIEDRLETLKGRLRRLRCKAFEEKQPSLFE